MAIESRNASARCLDRGFLRSAVSRAYYAAFAAATAALHKAGVKPPAGRESWPHQKLPDLVMQHLRGQCGDSGARDVKQIVRRCFTLRVDSDYVSARTVDAVTARRCLADASAVLKKLGVTE